MIHRLSCIFTVFDLYCQHAAALLVVISSGRRGCRASGPGAVARLGARAARKRLGLAAVPGAGAGCGGRPEEITTPVPTPTATPPVAGSPREAPPEASILVRGPRRRRRPTVAGRSTSGGPGVGPRLVDRFRAAGCVWVTSGGAGRAAPAGFPAPPGARREQRSAPRRTRENSS